MQWLGLVIHKVMVMHVKGLRTFLRKKNIVHGMQTYLNKVILSFCNKYIF